MKKPYNTNVESEYVITYTKGLPTRTYKEKLIAYSKYDAKKRFYQKYPRYDIVKVEEVSR